LSFIHITQSAIGTPDNASKTRFHRSENPLAMDPQLQQEREKGKPPGDAHETLPAYSRVEARKAGTPA
jgi:hypothetical protein